MSRIAKRFAQLKADNALDVVVAGAQYHHRQISLAANAPQHFDATQARKPVVDDHQVIAALGRLQQTCLAVAGDGHAEPLPLKIVGKYLAKHGIAVHQQ